MQDWEIDLEDFGFGEIIRLTLDLNLMHAVISVWVYRCTSSL